MHQDTHELALVRALHLLGPVRSWIQFVAKSVLGVTMYQVTKVDIPWYDGAAIRSVTTNCCVDPRLRVIWAWSWLDDMILLGGSQMI